MVRDLDMLFLVTIEPPLEAGDVPTVLARLRANWPPERLTEMLKSPLTAVVKAATRCLGMTGTMSQCEPLVALLGHADEAVVAAAEDALWGIWMRAGSERANEELARAVAHLRAGEFETALEGLRALSAGEDPPAEAHHQRALALHSLERYEEADAAYRAAVDRNRYHFAAMAGLGHLCVQGGDYRGALQFYRQALEIHPRLAEIRDIVPQLETAIQKRIVA